MALQININNGGTLTDICINRDGIVSKTKVLTTPYDLSKCFFEGLQKASRVVYGEQNVARLLEEADLIRYSTTQGTNAICERKGPRLGLMVATKDSEQWGFMTVCQGAKIPPMQGLFGGYSCGAYPLCKVKGVDVYDVLLNEPEKFKHSIEEIMNEQPFEGASYTTHHMGMGFEISKRGELFMISQGAGAGYGDLLERDPAGVIRDIEEGLLSPGVAERLYKVSFDPATLAINADATAALRDAERKARLARGVPFKEFVKTWTQPKPPAHLQYFGCWGDDVGTLYAGSADSARDANAPKPNYMRHPKDVSKHSKPVWPRWVRSPRKSNESESRRPSARQPGRWAYPRVAEVLRLHEAAAPRRSRRPLGGRRAVSGVFLPGPRAAATGRRGGRGRRALRFVARAPPRAPARAGGQAPALLPAAQVAGADRAARSAGRSAGGGRRPPARPGAAGAGDALAAGVAAARQRAGGARGRRARPRRHRGRGDVRRRRVALGVAAAGRGAAVRGGGRWRECRAARSRALPPPLLNVARHYRWSVALRLGAAPLLELPSVADIQALIGSAKATEGASCATGVDVGERLRSGQALPALGERQFHFAEIPRNHQPEQVLESLARLRA